jgi:hypothetical protein
LLNYIDVSVSQSRISSQETCPKGKVCLHPAEYQTLIRQNKQPIIPPNYTRERDLKVLQDPLYPAYNRTDKRSYEGIVDYTMKHQFNVPTQTNDDSYRLIGYLVNDTDTTSQKWKLFGKMKDRNRGDFYMMPVDRTQDMKIQIQDTMVVGEKMRSIDTVPDEIRFNTPLLADTPYKYIELPKGDFTDEYI